MRLEIIRHWFTDKSTSGMLKIDGIWTCFTLEDVARPDGVKIPGKTAIQAGEYPLIIDDSKRFMRPMPHVLDVPLFKGVRIHAGNTDSDTEGCILVGIERAPDVIWRSKEAFEQVYSSLQSAIKRGEAATLVVSNEPL